MACVIPKVFCKRDMSLLKCSQLWVEDSNQAGKSCQVVLM